MINVSYFSPPHQRHFICHRPFNKTSEVIYGERNLKYDCYDENLHRPTLHKVSILLCDYAFSGHHCGCILEVTLHKNDDPTLDTLLEATYPVSNIAVSL